MRKIASLLLCLVLLAALCMPVLAAEPELYYVTDAAWLLTDEQRETLEELAQTVSEQYTCGVYIITVDDFTDYVNTDDIYEAAKTIYRDYSLGLGEEKSGVLLMLSMEERDYTLIAYGYGNTAFTDYGKDVLADTFLDDFGEDDWYGGFSDYLEKSASMLESARAGNPLDVDSAPENPFWSALGAIFLSGLVSLSVCKILSRGMKSVSVSAQANAYVKEGSVVLTMRQDQYTHTTTHRVKIEKESSGGGTSVDSGGFSGKSGKF